MFQTNKQTNECLEYYWAFILFFVLNFYGGQDSSVSVQKGWTTGVQFPSGAMRFFLFATALTASGAHPASYRMDIGGLSLGV
jgi:hypothetical protein